MESKFQCIYIKVGNKHLSPYLWLEPTKLITLEQGSISRIEAYFSVPFQNHNIKANEIRIMSLRNCEDRKSCNGLDPLVLAVILHCIQLYQL